MPRNKDFKRLVRARMSKTGESFTAARTRVVARSTSPVRRPASAPQKSSARPAASPSPGYAAVAGTADATLKAKTGCTWARWVAALDQLGADRMSHREIAALVSSKYKVAGWWAQAVTVGYERIRGLRDHGQRRDGTYEANKSRTFDVPVERLFDAWADARLRSRWLDRQIGGVRTARAAKYMRLDGPDRTIVAVGFLSKGPSKSAVAVQHTKVRDRETANLLKQYWSERLDALRDVLAPR